MSHRKNNDTITQGCVSLEESVDVICQKGGECFNGQFTSNDYRLKSKGPEPRITNGIKFR